ncbi:MAG: DUF2318 domain-containing protein [Pseudomonadota bacterium]
MSGKEKMKSKRKSTAEKSAEKKAIILETQKKTRLPVFLAAGLGALLIAGAFLFTSWKKEGRSAIADPSVAQVSATSITYPVELFSDGKARHYRYKATDDITVQYFILKSSDGVIRAAFDACDVCWRAGKGYEQSGDFMVCRNCGRRFASVLVNEVKGGCNPAPLGRKIEDGKVVLQVEDILSGKQYFDFPRRG